MKEEKLQAVFKKMYKEKPLTDEEIIEAHHLLSHHNIEKRIERLEKIFAKRPPKIKRLKHKVNEEVKEKIPPEEETEIVKSKCNFDRLRELQGTIKFENKELLLKEIYEKRKEMR